MSEPVVDAHAGGRLESVSAALLVGGASRRMGRDKAHLTIDGVAAATRLARLLEQLFGEVLLVGGDPPADAPGRRVPDPEGEPSPLLGLVGALSAARAERVLVTATDLPLLTPDVLLALVAWPQADAVVPRAAGRPQPLCAVYRREPVLAEARGRVSGADRSLRGLLDRVETAYLEPADLAEVDPEGSALTNVNTPDELARAEALLRARGRAAPGASRPT